MKRLCLAVQRTFFLICSLLPALSGAESYTSPRSRFTVEYAAPWVRVNAPSAEITLSCDPFACGPDVLLTFNASFSERLKNVDTAEFVSNMFLRDETGALSLSILNQLRRQSDVYSASLVSEGESWSHLKNAKAYEVLADVTFTNLKRTLHQVFTTSNAGYIYTITLQYPHETRSKAQWAAEAVLDSFRFAGNATDSSTSQADNPMPSARTIDEPFIAQIRARYGDQAPSLIQPYMNRLIDYIPDRKTKELLRKAESAPWASSGFATCEELAKGTDEMELIKRIEMNYPLDIGRGIVHAAQDIICPQIVVPATESSNKAAPAIEQPSGLLGKIENDLYISPGNLYRVKIPHLMQPGAVIEDRQFAEGKYLLTMRDDFGTLYSILVARAEGRMAMAEIEDEVLADAELREQVTVRTARGEESRFLLLKKSGSHLQGLDPRKKTAITPDLIQATSIFAVEGHVLAVTAGKASLGQSPTPPSDNERVWKLVQQRLDQLVDGLVLLPGATAH